MNRAERIRSILTQRFSPIYLDLQDESARHAGHAGAKPGGETHYRLVIGSQYFNSLSKVQSHRAIYASLAQEFQNGLHALSIEVIAG